jgi:hypothetical protein
VLDRKFGSNVLVNLGVTFLEHGDLTLVEERCLPVAGTRPAFSRRPEPDEKLWPESP